MSFFRAGAIPLVLFAIAHTGGGMLSEAPITPEANAVSARTKTVAYTWNGARVSWCFAALATLCFVVGALRRFARRETVGAA